MQTPTKVTLEGFYQARAEFLKELCYTNPETQMVLCRACGGRLKVVCACIEIHLSRNGQCGGEGEQFEAGVPYCPGCEELPASRGCVHA